MSVKWLEFGSSLPDLLRTYYIWFELTKMAEFNWSLPDLGLIVLGLSSPLFSIVAEFSWRVLYLRIHVA